MNWTLSTLFVTIIVSFHLQVEGVIFILAHVVGLSSLLNAYFALPLTNGSMIAGQAEQFKKFSIKLCRTLTLDSPSFVCFSSILPILVLFTWYVDNLFFFFLGLPISPCGINSSHEYTLSFEPNCQHFLCSLYPLPLCFARNLNPLRVR